MILMIGASRVSLVISILAGRLAGCFSRVNFNHTRRIIKCANSTDGADLSRRIEFCIASNSGPVSSRSSLLLSQLEVNRVRVSITKSDLEYLNSPERPHRNSSLAAAFKTAAVILSHRMASVNRMMMQSLKNVTFALQLRRTSRDYANALALARESDERRDNSRVRNVDGSLRLLRRVPVQVRFHNILHSRVPTTLRGTICGRCGIINGRPIVNRESINTNVCARAREVNLYTPKILDDVPFQHSTRIFFFPFCDTCRYRRTVIIR